MNETGKCARESGQEKVGREMIKTGKCARESGQEKVGRETVKIGKMYAKRWVGKRWAGKNSIWARSLFKGNVNPNSIGV